ncbi:hypothetical protein J2N86_14535 (plasmid) [Legionella lytica]|uniref:Dot/Icm T4SS effector n=1 Tax=Legionella lytica TaxID=96232 RepID=A0ABY4YDX1_9GAMM|nr:hypothetical protein [Legionella lytica]USQ15455.1 hypothetical protein J2N86_14535 [Legionella lytica]
MPKIYRMDNFFNPVDEQSRKRGSLHYGITFTRDLVPDLDPDLPLTHFVTRNGTLRHQATPEIELIPNLSLAHFVRFRIENEPSFNLRDLAIELYSNSTSGLAPTTNPIIRVSLRTTMKGEKKRNFMRWCTTLLEENNISKEQYSFNGGGLFCVGGAQEEAIVLHTLDAFYVFIRILKNKIPQATKLVKDLECIAEFMQNPTLNFTHTVLEERTFSVGKPNEQINRIFHLVRTYRDSTMVSSFVSELGKLVPPSKIQAHFTVERENQQFYLVRHKTSKVVSLLDSFGKRPFEVYDASIRQNYELIKDDESVLETIHRSNCDDDCNADRTPPCRCNCDHEGNPLPKYPFFKRMTDGHLKLIGVIPQLAIMPIKEFDWLISHTPIHPDQLDLEHEDTLLGHVIRNNLADCLGTLLAHGFSRSDAYSPYRLETLYETIYNKINWMTPEHLEQCTSLHKMWSYFKPSLQPSLSNKETGVTSISLKATDTQINSTFFTYYSDRQPTKFETVFKSAALLSDTEKSMFSSLVEASFDSLITEHDKLEFSAAIAAKSSILSRSDADELWCALIEKRFKCTLSPVKKTTFLALMSAAEREKFYQLLPSSSTSDEFWNLIQTSQVRFSFNKDISGDNKFVELVHKKSSILVGGQRITVNELIAGTVHELLVLPGKQPIIIWHYVLAAKANSASTNASSKGDSKDQRDNTPQGLMQFLMFRGALSLGLEHKVVVVGFTLNKRSYNFVSELNKFFPKNRSESIDKFVLRVIRALYGNDIIIHQNGMAYYIQENTQAKDNTPDKNLSPSKTLAHHLFNKFNGIEPDSEPQAHYRAVPTVFSGSDKENRDKLTRLLPESQKHLYGFFKVLEPIVAESIKPNNMSLAKL